MLKDSPSISSLPPLDYLQVSPVRGQLEPYDEASRTGWCFLQCTDTPNELKVLLPPRTALMYAVLLKAELLELRKRRGTSWERLLEIRHLKDRMIRKCQRLGQAYSALKTGATTPFLTLHAPPDFRLKEMERWIRKQEMEWANDGTSRIIAPTDTTRVDTSFYRNREASGSRSIYHHHVSLSARRSVHSVFSHRSSTSKQALYKQKLSTSNRSSSMKSSAVLDEGKQSPRRSTSLLLGREEHNTTARVRPSANEKSSASINIRGDERHKTQVDDVERAVHVTTEDTQELNGIENLTSRNKAKTPSISRNASAVIGPSAPSPEPLPHPYRGSHATVHTPLIVHLDLTDRFGKAEPLPVLNGSRDPRGSETPSPPSDILSDSPEIPATDNITSSKTVRRRSSMKRGGSSLLSMSYSTKTVSWAMDRDWTEQISKYEAATSHLEDVDREWDAIREQYQDELAGIKMLRRNVLQTLEQLREEAEKLQREEALIQSHEKKLLGTFELLEQKHCQYRARVQAVLQESQQVLTLCSAKRDDEIHT